MADEAEQTKQETAAPETEALRADLEATRAAMGETVDEIAERVSPANIAARERAALAERVDTARTTAAARAQEQVLKGKVLAKRNPLAVATAGIAVVGALVGAWTASRSRTTTTTTRHRRTRR